MCILICIQNGSAPSMYSFDNINAALAQYHTELAYRHESRTSTMCMIIDVAGMVLKQETYIADSAEMIPPEIEE